MSKPRTAKQPIKKTITQRVDTSDVSTNPSDMKTSEIRDLIDFISKSGLNEVNIETKELKLHVKREPDQKILKSTAAPMMTAPVITAAAQQQPVATNQLPKAEKTQATEVASSSGKKTIEIKSPMIGTFYRSSSPDSPPFVSVGDKISKGQTVCIIEAMKLFNEIESEVSGTIVKILLENASPVEYDQVLYVVEPD